MSAINWGTFVDRLCTWLAAGASLEYAGTPRQLWQGSVFERDAADPYSEVRIYGGQIPIVPTPLVSLQCRTTGTSIVAATTQAAAIYACLVDAAGQPLRMVTIVSGAGGIRANAIDPKQPPSFVIRDDRGRAEVIFNWDMRLAAL